MKSRESRCHLGDDVSDDILREGLLVDEAVESGSIGEELGDHSNRTFVLEEVAHEYDVGMLDAREKGLLSLELGNLHRVFDRDEFQNHLLSGRIGSELVGCSLRLSDCSNHFEVAEGRETEDIEVFLLDGIHTVLFGGIQGLKGANVHHDACYLGYINFFGQVNGIL